MNAYLRKLFSLAVIDTEYLNEKQNKIEFVSCPRKAMKCKEQLSVINKIYIETELLRREKNYINSIETLKDAFYITSELTEHPCTKCAEVFRSTIVDSMENIHKELIKITSGIFANKNYQTSLTLAENTLTEFKSFNLRDNFKITQTKIQFTENNIKKKDTVGVEEIASGFLISYSVDASVGNLVKAEAQYEGVGYNFTQSGKLSLTDQTSDYYSAFLPSRIVLSSTLVFCSAYLMDHQSVQ